MKKRMPSYVTLGESGGIALRYVAPHVKRMGLFGIEEEYVEGRYYRDAGIWDVGYEWKSGVLMSKTDMVHLNNIVLVEITEEQWRANNKGYV